MRPADIARLLVLSALWGGSFIFMRVAAPALGPFVLVFFRVGIAGLVLLAYARLTGQQLALRERWRQYVMIGLLNSALPFVLIATAELRLTASLAAILNATTPLFGALIAAAWLREPLTARKLGGVALGLLGVGVVTGLSALAPTLGVLLSVAASLAAACSYGLAGSFIKARAAGAPALGMTVGSQLFAALLLAPSVPLTMPAAAPDAAAIGCTLALALLSTALAYVLYFRLMVDVGPVKTLTVTFLAPVFGVLWAALFLGERITGGTILGCAIVLVGTALVTGVRIPRPLPAGALKRSS